MREWTHWGYDTDYKTAGTGVEIIYAYEPGGSYEWDVSALVRRQKSDGVYEYAAYIDHGCSCTTSFDGHPDSYDLAWTDRPWQAYDEAIKHESYYSNDQEWKRKMKLALVKVLVEVKPVGDPVVEEVGA